MLPTYSKLMSVMFADQIETRSRKRKRDDGAADRENRELIKPTPLSELYVENVGPQQIWEQLEMRVDRVAKTLNRIVHGGYEANEEAIEDLPAGLDKEESEDEEAGSQESEDDDFEGPEPEMGEDDQEEHESVEYSTSLNGMPDLSSPEKSPHEPRRLSLANFDEPTTNAAGTPLRSPGRRSEVDDDFFALNDFHAQVDELETARGDEEDDIMEDDAVDLFAPISGLDDDEDAEDKVEDTGNADQIMYADFFDPPPRPFFRRGKDSSKERTDRSDAPSPRSAYAPTSPAVALNRTVSPPAQTDRKSRRVSFAAEVQVKTIPQRAGAAREAAFAEYLDAAEAADEADDDVDFQATGGEGSEESGDEDEGDEPAEGEDGDDDAESEASESAFERINTDLLADEEENQADSSSKSRYEQRQAALRQQIANLEAENVAQKGWTMKGEARSKERPLDSLLEEDLEFEHIGKVVPVVTEEMTASLEARIKKRILETDFDDVVRRRAFDPAAYLPSRLLDISGSKSDKSLAELYADEYSNERQRAEGNEVVHEVDAKLAKEHAEITRMFDDVCTKLDALSNAHFTPKAPSTSIVNVSNVPAISLESALPTTISNSTTLAPEEVLAPTRRLKAGKTELAPAEKQADRQRRRKQRATEQKRVDKLSGSGQTLQKLGSANKKGKKQGGAPIKGVKAEKAAALKKLVGNKGVTVIGKPSKNGGTSGKAREMKDRAVAKGGNAFKL